MNDGETHLRVSVLTDRLRVSSCVSISRVRLRLALWVLQHLGNRRPDGGCICECLRWHNKNAHWVIDRKQSCYKGGVQQNALNVNQTRDKQTSQSDCKKKNQTDLFFWMHSLWLINHTAMHKMIFMHKCETDKNCACCLFKVNISKKRLVNLEDKQTQTRTQEQDTWGFPACNF